MPIRLHPDPDGEDRRDIAERVREGAADVSRHRLRHPVVQANNGEVATFDKAVASFTKGLEHDADGLVNVGHFATFVAQLNQAAPGNESPFPGTYTSGEPAPFDVPHPSAVQTPGGNVQWRGWESPLAGHTFDLEGPDADAVSMPPAPRLGSAELTSEMAELYAMALLRDVPFDEIEAGSGGSGVVAAATTQAIVDELNKLAWFDGGKVPGGGGPRGRLSQRERRRRRARWGAGPQSVEPATLFRGSPPGAKTGPFISQFLLMGSRARSAAATTPPPPANQGRVFLPQPTPSGLVALSRAGAAGALDAAPPSTDEAKPADGFIQYGAQIINQRVVPHLAKRDYMTDWPSWLAVQNGADLRGQDAYEREDTGLPKLGRFIHTPRDLATFVHFDALYQAYLNTCLLMIGLGVPYDRGLPEGAGHPTRSGFATFGDPHVLTLVTEVATRALKAVRRQKYLIHLRARPEAVAGLATLARAGRGSVLGDAADEAGALERELGSTNIPGWIADLNKATAAGRPANPAWLADPHNVLLPMAFPEGSPMHPSYGAGHATVAGACATVLKAFFEMYTLDEAAHRRGTIRADALDTSGWQALFATPLTFIEGLPPAKRLSSNYRTNADGSELVAAGNLGLTIEGEINKIATNIAIGRDMAGVHYYTDYFESLRMGERVAVGILQEQMLTYREPVTMRFTSFDGDRILLSGSGGTRGRDDALVHVRDANGDRVSAEAWWSRASLEASA